MSKSKITQLLVLIGFFILTISQSSFAQYSQYIPDSSFNQTGQLLTTVQGQASCSLLLPDTSILLGGYGMINSNARFIVLRLNNDGSLNNQWGINGKVVDSFPFSSQDMIRDMLFLPSEKVLLMGQSDSTTPTSTYFKVALSKHLMNGALDSSFGINGKVRFSFSNNFGINSMAIQSDEKIVLAGGLNGNIAVCRLNTNGSIDSSFGTNGFSSISIGSLPMDAAASIKILPDDKILIGGHSYHQAQSWAAVVKFLANGGIDNSFGTNGFVETNVSGYGDYIDNLETMPNGKILASGYTVKQNGKVKILAIRYDSTGVLDPNFGNGGVMVKAINNNGDKSFSTVIQPDGKIVFGGYNTNANINVDFLLYRSDSSGNDDASFANSSIIRGNFFINQSNFNDYGQSMCAYDDGRILVAGYSTLSGAGSFAAMRWKPTIITPPTGIDETVKENEAVIVFPNPANDVLNIRFQETKEKGTLLVENLLGQQIICNKISQPTTSVVLPISFLSQGIYLLKWISLAGNVKVMKWLKE